MVERVLDHGAEHINEAEAQQVAAALGHIPDLQDVVLADYDEEMGFSRFVRPGALEDRVAYVRRVTGKPVVCVGRFTSPEAMPGQLQRGVLDFAGAGPAGLELAHALGKRWFAVARADGATAAGGHAAARARPGRHPLMLE